MNLPQYYSIAAPNNSGPTSYFLTEEDCASIDVKDFEAIPQENHELSDQYSEFFSEAYHECFPDALANEINNFVRLVAHPYRRCFDSPAKSPKNEEVESAIKNKGQKGCCTFQRENGKFIVRPLDQWMFFGNNLRRKHYYTSDTRVAMPYFDIDCHMAYQGKADADAARALIEQEMAALIGTAPLFLKSERGANGYLLVDLRGCKSSTVANTVFDELQDAIRLLFSKHEIMADFEVKGTISWRDRDGTLHAGRYGKLPMCASNWTYNWHRSLVDAKQVTLGELEKFIADVKAEVTDEDVARHEAAKRKAFLAHYLPVSRLTRYRLLRLLLTSLVLSASFGLFWKVKEVSKQGSAMKVSLRRPIKRTP